LIIRGKKSFSVNVNTIAKSEGVNMVGDQCEERKRTLILGEVENRSIAPITLELLQLGKMVAGQTGDLLSVALLGDNVSALAEVIADFSDEVYCIDKTLLEPRYSDFYVNALEVLCKSITPNLIIAGHSTDYLEVVPRLAYRLNADLVTDCISIAAGDNGQLFFTKPIFGDRLQADIVVDRKPAMVTVRQKSADRVSQGNGKGMVINFELTIDGPPGKIELLETLPGDNVSMEKAEAIVAGGRAFKTKEDLVMLEELAEVLRQYFTAVEIGASRALVDAGILSRSRQIGQTGEKVAPQIYIAVGISGASQHVSGISGSKKIIAINKDEEAPIFEMADYGVVGRYELALPDLIVKLRELL